MRRLIYVICPKCQNVMKTVDKGGVHIEQCEGCRGIFLDRGELEQIAGAESAYYANQAPPPYQPHAHQGGHAPTTRYGHGDSPRPYRGGHGDSPGPYRGGYADSPRGYRGGYSDSPGPYGRGGHRKRRGGFLENLFD
ncbi:zf-TFIIB domain-containing protein [Amycolatopsis minnesotensis]